LIKVRLIRQWLIKLQLMKQRLIRLPLSIRLRLMRQRLVKLQLLLLYYNTMLHGSWHSPVLLADSGLLLSVISIITTTSSACHHCTSLHTQGTAAGQWEDAACLEPSGCCCCCCCCWSSSARL